MRYPTLDKISEKAKKVIDIITNTKRKPVNKSYPKPIKPEPKVNSPTMNFFTPASKPTNSKSFNYRKPPVSQVAQTSLPYPVAQQSRPYHCNFCNVDGHSNKYCPNFPTLDDRHKRCEIQKLCPQCASFKHDVQGCPGSTNSLNNECGHCGTK